MARKRLNKKVAIIGSSIFALLIMLSIALVLYISRNPEDFIRDGDAALKSAREATDEKIKREEYARAERNYGKANGLTKSDDLRLVIFSKLLDIYIETEQWPQMMGCWNGIVNIEPGNIEARHGRLEYVYTVADSGGGPAAWQEVDSQASDFIDMIDEPALLESTKFRWESIKEDETLPMGKTLGSYLFLARGRARLTLTRMGVTTEPDILLTQAAEDLNQALEYEPDNVHIYWYLAQSALARGEMLVSRGNLDARNKAYQEARSYLQQAIDRLPEDVQSHINLSRIKFQQLSFNLPSGMTPDQFRKREEIVSYSADLFSISEKFRDDPKINFELSKFYQMFPEELDNAIEVADKAMTVDSENVSYALWSSNLHYRKFSVYHDKSEMDKALEIARQALELPGAQETTGPRNFINKNNRLALYFFLAGCYVEQLLEPVEQVSESERQEKLKNAEDAVHQIEQIFGSGEDPQVILWQGMLELAKGDSESAVRKLYSAYTQLKISGIEGTSGTYLRGPYSLLSYTLANYYKETPEKGAVFRFLVSAWRTGITINKPYVYLDIAEQVFELGDFQTTNLWVDRYETEHGIDVRSKKLRIRSYINTNRFEDAEKEMTSATELNELELTQLRLSLLQAKILQLQIVLDRKRIQETMRNSGIIQEEISEDASLLLTSGEDSGEIAADDSNEFISEEMKTYRQEYSDLIKEYVMSSPESLNEAMLLFACNNYLTLNDIESAQALVNIFLTYTPENLMALFYKEYLQEPEPSNISEQKRFEIRKNVLSNLSNQAEGWINLAGLHVTHNEYDKATEYFNKVVQVDAWENEQGLFERPVFEGLEPTYSQIQIAAGQLFGLSIDRQDWELARKIANIARVENLDECEGQYFYARLAFAENNYQEALSYIENALSLRPVFSHGYILRSTIHGELGSHTASIEDAREASNINPQNPDHAKRLALVLYQRNQRLGDTVTREQAAETREAFDRAINLNSSDRQLLSFYAEYISSTNPDHALAIRQYLYQSESNMENALLLGAMAMKIAESETSESKKKALLDMAGQSLSEAYKINSTDSTVLNTYSRYYRAIGQEDKAWEMLEGSQDRELLWRNYYSQGRYQEAKTILEQMFADNPTDSNSVLGLIMVSRVMGDIDGVKENSERLISLKGDVEDYLIQIQTFLEVGLVKEAELKLQSFTERFPDENRALLLKAWLMMRQGQLSNALQMVNLYLETNEESPIAWEVRGRIHYLMTDYNQAINDLNRSRTLLNSPTLSIYLSKAYMRAERDQEAIIELQNAMENPQVSETARLLLEQTYKKLNRKDTLNRFYDNTIRELPGSVLWHLKAASFLRQEKEFSRASRLYKRALQLSMESGQDASAALDGYLSSLILDGKYTEAFEEVPRYVNGEYASIALFRMAEAKLKLGDRTSAIEYCGKALDGSDPSKFTSTRIVDKVYTLLGKEVLYSYCQERIASNPESERINFIMFHLMLNDNEQYNKALEYINNSIQIAGSESPQSLIYILEKARVLNLAYEKTSDKIYLNKAIEEHKSLLLKMPNNIGVLNNLAFLLAESDEALLEALEYARKAYEVQPNNPNILDTYAFVLYKNGKYEQAAELIQAAVQVFEDNKMNVPALVYEHLGMIREKLGLKEEAIDAYKQALSIGGLSERSINRLNSEIDKMSQTDF